MFQRLTDIMKNRIDRFLSQELSPEEIEEMHLNEGLGLEDVEGENLADMVEMFAGEEAENAFHDPFCGPFDPLDPTLDPLRPPSPRLGAEERR